MTDSKKPELKIDKGPDSDGTTIISVSPGAGQGGQFQVNSFGDLIIGNEARENVGRALVVEPGDTKGLGINYANDFGSVSIHGVTTGSGPKLRSLMIDPETGRVFHEG